MNKQPYKNSTIPRYSDKYKDILERAMVKTK